MKRMLHKLVGRAGHEAGNKNRRQKKGTMEERRNTMERKKFGAGLIALVAGIALSAGSAFAQLGYLQGDPSIGKLIPAYEVSSTQATIIGLENTLTVANGVTAATNYIFVHVVIFDTASTEVFDATLCLSPYDFGYIILQNAAATATQLAETGFGVKILVASVAGDFIPTSGYVTLATTATGTSCTTGVVAGTPVGLSAWTILQDVGTGFFATEIPTTSAGVNTATGVITCATTTCPGLIPNASNVVARYDINPTVGSVTSIYVWLNSAGTLIAGGSLVRNVSGFLQCEHELQISTTIPMPLELNVINPATLGGVGQCIQVGQYRGVLRFAMPDTGFLWSHISQSGSNFRMNFPGYNMTANTFIP
jgi:hypothetical protein